MVDLKFFNQLELRTCILVMDYLTLSLFLHYAVHILLATGDPF